MTDASLTDAPALTAPKPAPAPHATQSGLPVKYIWLVAGPAGCGKTTVGRYLATTLRLPYIEGDEFHPPANVAKMAAGHALTDTDRWDWLLLLRTQALAALVPDNVMGVVMTCSALKRAYRDVLRGNMSSSARTPDREARRTFEVQERFIFLQASEEVLLQRVQNRQGHYMKAGMVESQVEVLEQPGDEERGDCITLNVGKEMGSVLEEALGLVGAVMNQK